MLTSSFPPLHGKRLTSPPRTRSSFQSSPRALIQIFIVGSRIIGKAFLEAGRQAVKSKPVSSEHLSPVRLSDAKNSPAALSDVSGVSNATGTSVTDQLTRAHRMTLDEAHLILNVKHGEQMEKIFQV
jgi:mitochondrial import inner membrane translocase subunit TIM16